MLMRDHHGEGNAKRLRRRGIKGAPDAEEHPGLICSTGQSPGCPHPNPETRGLQESL